MQDAGAINAFLEKKLAALKRDGVSAVEAAKWLAAEKLLPPDKRPLKRLQALLRAGKIRAAYQFPNKRWVIVNRSRLPDGIQRVVPIREAAETLRVSESFVRSSVKDGKLTPLSFGPYVQLFLEEDVKQFNAKYIERSFRMMFPENEKHRKVDVDRLKRQLYYLRSDIRLIAERIEELTKLLE